MATQRFTRIAIRQRKSPRQAKDHPVRLVFGDGFPEVSGKLTDLSSTGARVSVAVRKDIPERFTLYFHDDTSRRCRLVWRSPKSIGIEFVFVERRSGKDRRKGGDTRSEDEKRLIGERRSNRDRRSGLDRRSNIVPAASPPTSHHRKT